MKSKIIKIILIIFCIILLVYIIYDYNRRYVLLRVISIDEDESFVIAQGVYASYMENQNFFESNIFIIYDKPPCDIGDILKIEFSYNSVIQESAPAKITNIHKISKE